MNTYYVLSKVQVLRLVAIMLLIPLDTSEAERIFSLLNDIKTSERASLGQRNLAALMFWHYHGHKLKAWQVPVEEIFKEFRALAADKVCCLLTYFMLHVLHSRSALGSVSCID